MVYLCTKPDRCWVEYEGYPGKDQVGRSTDSNNDGVQDIQPLYEWNNLENGENTDFFLVFESDSIVLKEGRDYYNNTPRPGYSPYQYPHPLIGSLKTDNSPDIANSVYDVRINKNAPDTDKYFLGQNYPDPFSHFTIIPYNLLEISDVIITIRDISGNLIKRVQYESQEPGMYTFQWDARENTAGIYFYHLKAGKYRKTKSMLLIHDFP